MQQYFCTELRTEGIYLFATLSQHKTGTATQLSLIAYWKAACYCIKFNIEQDQKSGKFRHPEWLRYQAFEVRACHYIPKCSNAKMGTLLGLSLSILDKRHNRPPALSVYL